MPAARSVVAAAREFQRLRAASVLRLCHESARRGWFEGDCRASIRIKVGLADLRKLEIVVDDALLRELNAAQGVRATVAEEDSMLGRGKVLWVAFAAE
jgi:hypothetical protein